MLTADHGDLAPIVGICRDTVKWLRENGFPNLSEEDVEIEYSANPKLFRADEDPYLVTKRIELDSIIEKVGAEAFWRYLVRRLDAEFPGKRDYREIIPEPETKFYYSDEINEFLDYVEDCIRSAYDDEWTRIKNEELSNVDGLLDVEEKISNNEEKLKRVVQSNEDLKIISLIVIELMESEDLPKPRFRRST